MSVAKTRGIDSQTVTGIVSFPFKNVGGTYSWECVRPPLVSFGGSLSKVPGNAWSHTKDVFLCYCVCLKQSTREGREEVSLSPNSDVPASQTGQPSVTAG